MTRSRRRIGPADLRDALLTSAAVAYVLGFLAALQAALGKPLY